MQIKFVCERVSVYVCVRGCVLRACFVSLVSDIEWRTMEDDKWFLFHFDAVRNKTQYCRMYYLYVITNLDDERRHLLYC